jgi:hypothetical protein
MIIFSSIQNELTKQQTNGLCFIGARATKTLSICAPARYADAPCDRLRCYMRPALNHHYTPTASSNSSEPTVRDFENDDSIWKHDTSLARRNLLHQDLNDVMFYL